MPDFNTVDEVRAYAADLLSRQQPRISKHIRIERLYRLEKWVLQEIANHHPEKQDDWPTVTLNEPRTFYNAIRRACGKYPIRHQIELPQLPTDEEHKEINLHERLLIGAWNDTDLLRRRRSQGRFQGDAIWFTCVRGGVFVRPLIENGAPFTPFRNELWDPAATVYEPGSTGLAFVAHARLSPKGAVEEDFGKEDESIDANGNIALVDVWWKGSYKGKEGVYNVILGPKTVFKGPEDSDWGPEPFEDVPVFCVKTGSPAESAKNGDGIGQERQADAWETIFDANEMIYAWLNRIASLFGLIIRQGAIGPYSVDEKAYKTYGDKIAQQLKPFGIVPAQVQGITPPAMATEAKEFFSFLQGAAQRGGVPYSTFGQVAFEMSGFGINQLQGGIEVSALSVSQTLEDAYWLSDDEILRQARRLKGKFHVQGLDNAGKAFMEDIRSAKLDKNYIVRTSGKIALPQDDLMRAQVAQTLDTMGVSKLTLFDQYLELQDPMGEYKRRMSEDADRDPVIKAMKMAQAAYAQGQPTVAQWLLTAYVQPAMQQVAGPSQPSPEMQPPESRGETQQHEEFQTPPQNVSAEAKSQAMGTVLGG